LGPSLSAQAQSSWPVKVRTAMLNQQGEAVEVLVANPVVPRRPT